MLNRRQADTVRLFTGLDVKLWSLIFTSIYEILAQ